MLSTTRDRVAHLLRRAGFGGTPQEIDDAARAGLEATVDRLLDVPPEDEFPHLDAIDGRALDFDRMDDIRSWWVHRMIHTTHPLLEKMTLFWHGHFATSYYKVESPRLLLKQNQTFRRLALSNFGEMLMAVSRDPAMTIWLDNVTNRKGAPNENYAREVMELFTIGVVLYTEQDVAESARAFTGFAVKDGEFWFDEAAHDDGEKTFLGRRGRWKGEDIVRRLADLPETGRFLGRKLFEFFGHVNPPESMVKELAHVYLHREGSMRDVMRTLLLSEAFYSEASYMAHIKSPTENAVGAVRLTGASLPTQRIHEAISAMGQELFDPPTVKGWDGHLNWISSAAMFERFNFAAALVRSLQRLDDPDWVGRLLQRSLSAERKSLLAGHAGRGLLHLLLCSPEFQFS